MSKRMVVFDHDGGIDDLIALMLLLQMEDIELIGVTLTPADCYLSDALLATQKLLTLCGQTHIPIGLGRCHGVNAFPSNWRAQPKIVLALPQMLNLEPDPVITIHDDAESLLTDIIRASDTPVTVVMTGPCTNLSNALDNAADLTDKIEQAIWMGGALNVRGNVVTFNHNGSAEWNAFWDPDATARFIASSVEKTLVPLDATNCLPIDMDFLRQLARQSANGLSELAGQFWAATVNTLPSYEFTYYMWDVLTVLLLAPEFAEQEYQTKPVVVYTTEPMAGAIKPQQIQGQFSCPVGAKGQIRYPVNVNRDIAISTLIRLLGKSV